MKPKLTSRDISILVDVCKYRYLSVSQVQKLHFPSKRTAWRRLQALTTLGCLKAFTTPNIPERLFYLHKPGAEIVAGELRVDVQDLKGYHSTNAPKDYYFLKHFMAINDFRILLTQACNENRITLLGFIPEYIGEKTKQGYVKKYIRDNVCDVANTKLEYSHTPDAVFALEKDGNAALFFLEIDKGTEIISDPEKGFLKCVVFYLNYWQDGKFHRYESDFNGREFKTFRTLIITTSATRLQHMREAVTGLAFTPAYVKRFLWGSTEGRATKQLLFEPIWHSMDTQDSTHYQIG